MSARRSFLVFVALALLGLALVVLLSRAAPVEARQPFNAPLRSRLGKLRPDVVLIGNSMVNSRFSEPELQRLLAPKRVAVLGIGGSKSAFWYLLLKNVVLPASKPKKVLLFYRRRELTTPTDRAVGIEHRRLDRVTAEDDPFVEGVLAPRWDDPVARLGWHLGRLAPAGRLRALLTPPLDTFASGTAGLLGGRSGRADSKAALEKVFDVGKLRSGELEPAEGRRERDGFRESLPHSFLPAIVELVNGAGAELTLVKIRTPPPSRARGDARAATRRHSSAGVASTACATSTSAATTGRPSPSTPKATTPTRGSAAATRACSSSTIATSSTEERDVIFHSLDFALFLVVFLALYWVAPERARNPLLLAGSYFFYGYVHPWFLLLLAGSTLADYSYARAMAHFPGKKRIFLLLSLATNLGLLATFKYFDFFSTNVAHALATLGFRVSPPLLGIALPVGISFYTFQSLSYTIDVYRGRIEARRSLLDLATFLALFPQLVAGPIERATTMLPQVEAPKRFDPEQAWRGLLLMAWGFTKKLVVADNVALIANKVFALSDPTFSLVWVGTLAFGVQIYADFSAYSDIARGTARLLGFELMKNFDHPYLSETPAEFWRRWHISLSTWFRDYVYIPLGGSRGSSARTARNLMLTFLLSGFWHGASWNFLMWGGYHGLLLVGHRALERRVPWLLAAPRLRPLRVLLMFALVNVGWLMFRETDVSRLLADLTLSPFDDTRTARLAAFHLLALTLVYALPLVVDSVLYRTGAYERAEKLRAPAVAGGLTAALLVLLTAFLHSEASSDFIYFQF